MTGTPPYAELHCHSAYSFLDGASLPEELAGEAFQRGYRALALTDHNSVSGSMEFAKTVPTGLKAIHGAEIDVAAGDARHHLTLLVRDERGWRNLCRIVTRAHSHTRDSAGRQRTEPSVALEVVLEHAQGLVCLTGCAEHGVRSLDAGRRLLDAFAPQSLRVELQRPYARNDRARNRALAALARKLGVACVATGNVHAHSRARARLQDAFVALGNHTTLDASEPLRRGNHAHAMADPQAMAERFSDHPDAVRETVCLAEQLDFDLTRHLGYSYPGAEDEQAMGKLTELCRMRLVERYAKGSEKTEAETRLEQELKVIARLGLAGFFLLHHDMLDLAREVAAEVRGTDSVRALMTPGRGRGSSVSSVVCYLTGLSHIDPIRNSLLLGRFLHDELKGLPDIDLDFPREIRKVLIPRVHERYGNERVALVAAFPTFRTRGAIRELGKALGLPAGEIERVARTADNRHGELAGDIAAGREGTGFGAPSRSVRWAYLERLVHEAYGLPRHLSQHSGGMVISTRPLIDCCPVVPAAMEGRQMVQWDKDSCADAGFLKIDLLGLGMLSAVERCVEEIVRVRGKPVDLSRISFEDDATFQAIRTADTVGVFQIESRAQMQSLRRTLPDSLDDLTVQVAIVRPGPIQGGAINPYIERLQDKRARVKRGLSYEVPYEHPAIAEVLKDTLGTIIFQDQVMQVSEAFAGFTPGEADALRRAMSRKRSHEEMQKQRGRFLAGAMRHSEADLETAERVWGMVEGFAGFGFPKAHAAAFGLLAYQSTWLRVHYGPEFLCALLNEQPMGFYAPDSLVHEAQRRGIPVLGLDVNASGVECAVRRAGDRLGVRLGLAYVKGATEQEVRELVAERELGGRYLGVDDLAARTATRRATLEAIAWSGACDSLVAEDVSDPHARRRVALWQLGIAAPGEAAGAGVQLALPIELPSSPRLRPLDRWQRVLADYATSEVTVEDHVMATLRSRLVARDESGKPLELSTSARLANLADRSSVTVAGLVIARQRPGTANGTMFLLFEDELGVINLIVPAEVYERHRPLARAEPLLLARGRLERAASGVVNVLVSELARLERFLAPVGEGAQVRRLTQTGSRREETQTDDPAEMGADMRALAPPVQSFAVGRRR